MLRNKEMMPKSGLSPELGHAALFPKNSLLKADAVEIQPQRRIQSSQGVSIPRERTILPLPLDFRQKGMLHLLQLAKPCT